jgi:hypothetical protein
MKKNLALLALVFMSVGPLSAAQPKKLGIGVVLGAPTGFSVKYWNDNQSAWQGAFGTGFDGITIGVDYLIHSNAFNNAQLPFYYGPGAFFGSAGFGGPKYVRGDLALGGRFIFGVDYLTEDKKFDIAFELGPALLLSPSVGMGIEAGIAFRFYP